MQRLTPLVLLLSPVHLLPHSCCFHQCSRLHECGFALVQQTHQHYPVPGRLTRIKSLNVDLPQGCDHDRTERIISAFPARKGCPQTCLDCTCTPKGEIQLKANQTTTA
jgi:hypothetical protein